MVVLGYDIEIGDWVISEGCFYWNIGGEGEWCI